MVTSSWEEIRTRALAFSRKWAGATSEAGEAQTFWNEFFEVFGASRRRLAKFEHGVKKADNHIGRIDLFLPGVMLAEHKSAGKDLHAAYQQARDYIIGLPDKQLPRYIVVSDFARFRLHDLDEDSEHEFALEALHDNVERFGFLAGYITAQHRKQERVTIRAAERMGKLYTEMLASGYDRAALGLYLVRVLFCLFAEDTAIFQRRHAFERLIKEQTRDDGLDLGGMLQMLFQALRYEQRNENIAVTLRDFPYINGPLFDRQLPIAAFNAKMRAALLACCELDWGEVSPDIFGSLFQSVLDADQRHDLGAHYTSEGNILKVINPLFMDELWAEFERAKQRPGALRDLHAKLGAMKFFDPACGCGNFLIVAYRELRLLELEVLQVMHAGQQSVDANDLSIVNVDQFYGMEIEEFPCQIARVAMWLTDHLMNRRLSKFFGFTYARIPLVTQANIVCTNALTTEWEEVVAPAELNFIMGNPPFLGSRMQSPEQKRQMNACYQHASRSGSMDFVSAWFVKAGRFIRGRDIRVGFVATNSITQGEQVLPLWEELRADGPMHIHFAHRSFKWTNKAKDVAAVTCVIIGFGENPAKKNRLFDYVDSATTPVETHAANINPYLVDAPDVVVAARRSKPLNAERELTLGCETKDDGHLMLTREQREDLLTREPRLAKYIRPLLGSRELINRLERYCFWLVDCPPEELGTMPEVMKRVEAVRAFRKASKRKATADAADYPWLFASIGHSDCNRLMIPGVSSNKREYAPMDFIGPEPAITHTSWAVNNATTYEFGVLTSAMHMGWMRAVCGRLGMGYYYSGVVYNNFVWPEAIDDQRAGIAAKAQAVLDARDRHPNVTLANLYNPLVMPVDLRRAHTALDKAVDKLYRPRGFAGEGERVAHLFALYQEHIAPLLPKEKTKRKVIRRKCLHCGKAIARTAKECKHCGAGL